MALVHRLSPQMLQRRVLVTVVGAGGTGAQVVIGLGRLHATLLALGHPGGLDVIVYDDDVVQRHNVGRQPFYVPDVGMPKAQVLVHRMNMAYGTKWRAEVCRFGGPMLDYHGLFIGCVDSKASRRIIASAVSGTHAYWLDFGNGPSFGQVVLGRGGLSYGEVGTEVLPWPSDLLPELVTGPEDVETPTCSVAASVERQGLFVNQMVATWGLQMLDLLFRTGEIGWHGVFFDAAAGRATQLPVDVEVWKRMGWRSPKPPVEVVESD